MRTLLRDERDGVLCHTHAHFVTRTQLHTGAAVDTRPSRSCGEEEKIHTAPHTSSGPHAPLAVAGTVSVSVEESGRMMGLNDSECGQMGVNASAGTVGNMMLPPADRE